MLLLSHLERATLLPAKLFVSLHGALTLSYRQGTSSCLMLLSTNQKNKSIFAFFSERLDMQCQPGAACRLQSVLRSLLSPWSSGVTDFPFWLAVVQRTCGVAVGEELGMAGLAQSHCACGPAAGLPGER